MPVVDIVIPVYNQARKLRQCLASITQQTFQDFQVTIVDDGSTDHPENVVGSFDYRIKIIRQEQQGASAARNTGAEKGSAPYILFCDADVILNPNFLNKHLSILHNKSSYSFSYPSFKYGRKTFRSGPFDAGKLQEMPYIHTTALIRREHFPGFDENLKRFQDWDLWLTMLEQGHTGVWIDEVLFTVLPGGLMSRWLPKAAYRWLPWLPEVKKYNKARQIILSKHRLNEKRA